MRLAVKLVLSFLAGSALAFLVMQPATERPRAIIESILEETLFVG